MILLNKEIQAAIQKALVNKIYGRVNYFIKEIEEFDGYPMIRITGDENEPTLVVYDKNQKDTPRGMTPRYDIVIDEDDIEELLSIIPNPPTFWEKIKSVFKR